MAPPYRQAVLTLALKTGGVPALASRCAASEAAVLAWIAGELLPSRDEHFLLQLIARKEGAPFPTSPSLESAALAAEGGDANDASEGEAPTLARSHEGGEGDYEAWRKTQE